MHDKGDVTKITEAQNMVPATTSLDGVGKGMTIKMNSWCI